MKDDSFDKAKDARNDDSTDSELVAFIKTLPSLKNLKVYGPGEAEKADPATLPPTARRLLLREKNSKKWRLPTDNGPST